MAHLNVIYDDQGDTVDYNVFCSDFCNQDYCRHEKIEYQGEFACQEIPVNTPCKSCNNLVQGIDNFDGEEQTLEDFEKAKRIWESENTVTQRIWP